MRDLFKKVMAGSMIAGAALLVSACGGGENAEANNTAMTDMNAMDPMMDTTNDVTAIDAGTGADANMTMDANMTGTGNTTTTTTNTTTTDANMTNGM
ncbi:MAG TPA: hypothetical protein VNT77_10110 [Allosphingosinicella sp.]|nr:hypothetical protein [Allosphingosinicella sp.]